MVILFSEKFYSSLPNIISAELETHGMLQSMECELWQNESAEKLNNQSTLSVDQQKEETYFTCDDFKLLVSRFGLCICGCIPCLLCITECQK